MHLIAFFSDYPGIALSPTRTTISEIGETLGLDRHMISKCQRRFDQLDDGEWEELFDDRQALRSDIMDGTWVEFARKYWTDSFLADPETGEAYNFVRRSEKMSDEMRDPSDRKSKDRYRIFWLEEKVNVMYEAMKKAGKYAHGDSFHMSWPYFLSLRPFWVKDATRDTCMCIYHLRWREFANGLTEYRKSLRREQVSLWRNIWSTCMHMWITINHVGTC